MVDPMFEIPTRIALGADHNGVILKEDLKQDLVRKGFSCTDFGPFHPDIKVDYVDFAYEVAQAVATGNADFGILVCGTGVGMSIAANKIASIRAALVHNLLTAKKSREHNNANILCLGVWINDTATNLLIAETWIREPFGGERHIKRIAKLDQLDEKLLNLKR